MNCDCPAALFPPKLFWVGGWNPLLPPRLNPCELLAAVAFELDATLLGAELPNRLGLLLNAEAEPASTGGLVGCPCPTNCTPPCTVLGAWLERLWVFEPKLLGLKFAPPKLDACDAWLFCGELNRWFEACELIAGCELIIDCELLCVPPVLPKRFATLLVGLLVALV